ncbi:hypothetical protein OXX69_009404 [Metschnikowia pulcherrima]
MAAKFSYSCNDLPEFITEPVRFLSVVSNSSDTKRVIHDLLQKNYLYKSSNISHVMDTIQTLVDSPAKYYSLKVTQHGNTLKLDSRSPQIVTLTMDQYTYHHHSYAGRYIKFKKSQPAKGSPEFVTYYSATVDWQRKEKYQKDLHAVIDEVFGSAELVLFTETPYIQKNVGQLEDLHKNALSSETALFVPKEIDIAEKNVAFSDMEKRLPEKQMEMYEFLALVHMNALPDYEDSHVRATNMYEIPETAANLAKSLETATLTTVSHVSPALFYDIVKSPGVISVQATTEQANFLVLNTENGIVTWTIKQ